MRACAPLPRFRRAAWLLCACPFHSKTPPPTSSAKRSAGSRFPTVNSRSERGWRRRKSQSCATESLRRRRSAPSHRCWRSMPESLLKLAEGRWEPEQVEEIEGLAQFNTIFGDMTVNAYLVWDPRAREAVAFDTGADCTAMLARDCAGTTGREFDPAHARASGSHRGSQTVKRRHGRAVLYLQPRRRCRTRVRSAKGRSSRLAA